ncbi:MAG: DUF1015 domain-containing protein [Sedimentisphaerales bacterium]|nr:DUF1015 domain-containing protein [Sedimentisphaerales bacterium]
MEVKPFKAFRFDADVVGDVGSCIAPPYDVINSSLQRQLYKKSKYNIVRIIRAKTNASDNADDNQYTRAADYLKSWIERGVLKQDLTESIYAYIQDFEVGDSAYQRLSFIALAKIEELGPAIRDHEEILTEPAIDRLNLTRATKAQFGLPFCLYEDEQQLTEEIIEGHIKEESLIDFYDMSNHFHREEHSDQEPSKASYHLATATKPRNEIRHRLFAITDKGKIDAIIRMILNKTCIIADGHHRYATALNYSKETDNPAAKFQMMAFTNARHGGLVILATHRLVGGLDNFALDKLINELKTDFEISQYSFDSLQNRNSAKLKMLEQLKAAHGCHDIAFGVYGGNKTLYTAKLENEQAIERIAPEMSRASQSVDVSVLHKLILGKYLGIGEEQVAGGHYIEYVKDADNSIDESIAKVDAGHKQLAFFVNPVRIQQLKQVTEAGEKMPQKSTYFFPKIYTGLTINKL